MKPFFDSKDKIDNLFVFFKKWEKTPFIPRTRILNGGIDCVQLGVQLCLEYKIPVKIPDFRYCTNWGTHKEKNILKEYLENLNNFKEVSKESLMPGDLILFNVGKTSHHLGIILDVKGDKRKSFMHVIKDSGVCRNDLCDSAWGSKVDHIFRIYQS